LYKRKVYYIIQVTYEHHALPKPKDKRNPYRHISFGSFL